MESTSGIELLYDEDIMAPLEPISLAVLNRGPLGTRDWSSEFLQCRPFDTPTIYQVLGLAEGSAGLARHSLEQGNSEGRDWAVTSLYLYELLAERGDKDLRQSAELSAMYLRSWMIVHLGIDGTSLTDPEIIEKWFFDRLEITLERARTLSAMNIDQVLNDLRDLRAIKNRIHVLKLIAAVCRFKREEEVSDWLTLWEHIP